MGHQGVFDEMLASLTAVAAAAFAVEAEKIRIYGHEPMRNNPAWAPPGTRTIGDHLGQQLLEDGALDEPTARNLGRLFTLRNGLTHPEHRDPAPGEPHPTGTSTSWVAAAYHADVAACMVELAETVVQAMRAHDVGQLKMRPLP